MDPSSRAELAALRRRAYDRGADIASDPVALERLAELEELALESEPWSVPASTRTPSGALATASDPIRPASATGTGRALSPNRPLIFGAVAALAVVATTLGAAREPTTVPNPPLAEAATTSPPAAPATTDLAANDPVIIPLLVDDRSGEFIDVAPPPGMPVPLANGATIWAQPLGIHFGWEAWAVGTSSGQGRNNCLLLTDRSATEVKCVPRDATARGALEVSVAYDELAAQQRPPSMTPEQRVSFTWGDGAYIRMRITADDPAE